MLSAVADPSFIRLVRPWLLCGCFAVTMTLSPAMAVLAIIDGVRFRLVRFIRLAVIMTSLTMWCWWHAIYWPVAGR